MTEQMKEEFKVKLIELGFWGGTGQGAPVTDHRDSQTLQERLARLLADDVTLASTGFSIDSPAQRVEVVKGSSVYPLATADSYPEAISSGAGAARVLETASRMLNGSEITPAKPKPKARVKKSSKKKGR
jgi:hypothetical protein